MQNKNLCFLDLETTGFDETEDSIIEISFIVHSPDGTEIDRFDQVIIPDKSPLSDFVSDLTGITESEIEKNGQALDQVLKNAILSKIGDAIIVGHNIDFDIRFLEGNGIPVTKNNRIDTHELARIVLIGEESYALEILSKKYGFQHTNAHRAMSDVEVSIDLYQLLLEKINELPADFIEASKPFLDRYDHWIAGQLLLNSKTTGTHIPKVSHKDLETTLILEMDEAQIQSILDRVSEKPQFVRAGIANRTAEYQSQLANRSTDKSVIITDKFDYFSAFKSFPTPYVVLDPERLAIFGERGDLANLEITFYLQVLFRHLYGVRGKRHFDLFFQQNNYWDQIRCQDSDSQPFQAITKERESEKVLTISPAAWWDLHELPIFQNRTLIIDEVEKFGEKLLHSPTKDISLLPLLNHQDEAISTGVQFWITRFAQTVIKPHLGHEIGPFAAKVLLKDHERFPEFAQELEQYDFVGKAELIAYLTNPIKQLVRWYIYNPKNGQLSFHQWHPDDWREAKQTLENRSIIPFYRHKPGDSQAFLRIFLGISDGDFHEAESLQSRKSWEVIPDFVSVKSPDFNLACAQAILSTTQDKASENIAVLFSSGETLKKVWLETKALDVEEKYKFFGERVQGGKGKMLTFMREHQPATTFFQKINGKVLEPFQFKTVILQKFLFDPPHPLLDKLDESFAQGIKLWDVWTIPQVSANLSRRIADFPDTENIICLDGRHNAAWGKQVLSSAFPEIFES